MVGECVELISLVELDGRVEWLLEFVGLICVTGWLSDWGWVCVICWMVEILWLG